MSSIQRRRLQVEVLESRDVLSTTSPVIDPTLQPSDPSNTAIQVAIASVGPGADGQHFSVTVQGVSPSNLQPGGSFQLVIDGTVYNVDAVTLTEGGDYQMLVAGETASGANTTATLIIGNGGNTPPATNPPPETPPPGPVIDPTLSPQP